jgi:hypothetical protein
VTNKLTVLIADDDHPFTSLPLLFLGRRGFENESRNRTIARHDPADMLLVTEELQLLA